jgi:hypothetical protein
MSSYVFIIERYVCLCCLQLQKQNHIIQDTCAKPKHPEAVKNDLKTRVQAVEDVLNRNVEEQEELQNAISRLTKTVGLLNQTVHGLCGQPEVVSTCKVEVSKYIHCGTLDSQIRLTWVKQQSFGDVYCRYIQTSARGLNCCVSRVKHLQMCAVAH